MLALAMTVPRARGVIVKDIERWAEVLELPTNDNSVFTGARLAGKYREFRTLLCYRVKRCGTLGQVVATLLNVLYPGERTLHISTSEIGPGLFIQHGFATIIAARSIGANCWINQQVTIGFDRPGERPTIGNGVSIFAGAKVLGNLHVGDNARIGANAVVLADVPADHTAVGIPARHIPIATTRHGRDALPDAPSNASLDDPRDTE